MVRVCCSSACCKFQVVTSYDTVYVTSADSSRCLLCNTARTHCTDTAANAFFSKFTMGCLIFYASTARRQRRLLRLFPGDVAVAASNSSTVVNLNSLMNILLLLSPLLQIFFLEVGILQFAGGLYTPISTPGGLQAL